MHNSWKDPVTLTGFIIAVTGLVTAIGGIIAGRKTHNKVKNDITPDLEQVKQDIQEVKDGTTNP